MAMSSTVLATLLKAKLIADEDSQATPGPALDALCKAVAEAVVEHIAATAVVTGVGTAPPGGGPVPVTGTVS